MSEDPVRNAYRLLFGAAGEHVGPAKAVLDDLRNYCFADRSTILPGLSQPVDAGIEIAMNEGRRQTWLRIMRYLEPEPPVPPAEQAEMEDE